MQSLYAVVTSVLLASSTKEKKSIQIYTTKGRSSPILCRSEEDRVELCDKKT